MVSKVIKVLVVDDSLLFRETLAKGIGEDPAIQVVAKASDPFDARDKILAFEPDVMICDVQMPKMNGIEFIKRLLPQYAIPVIIVSAISDAVFDSMNAGAVDFVTKPEPGSAKGIEGFIREVIAKIKIASQAKVMLNRSPQEGIKPTVSGFNAKRIIAMGASTGGTEALFHIIKDLPPAMPGIVIVQHIPPVFSRMFADRLKDQTQLLVKEAESGDYLAPGRALVAPGDQHMRVKRVGDQFKVEVFYGEKVNGHCPSVDVLFESVAKEAGENAVGVILTGMGYDGAKGLLAMRRKGARTIGQDEASSVVYGMPKVAYEVGAVEKQAPLQDISKLMQVLCK